jgi:hypothetical protein
VCLGNSKLNFLAKLVILLILLVFGGKKNKISLKERRRKQRTWEKRGKDKGKAGGIGLSCFLYL